MAICLTCREDDLAPTFPGIQHTCQKCLRKFFTDIEKEVRLQQFRTSSPLFWVRRDRFEREDVI